MGNFLIAMEYGFPCRVCQNELTHQIWAHFAENWLVSSRLKFIWKLVWENRILTSIESICFETKHGDFAPAHTWRKQPGEHFCRRVRVNSWPLANSTGPSIRRRWSPFYSQQKQQKYVIVLSMLWTLGEHRDATCHSSSTCYKNLRWFSLYFSFYIEKRFPPTIIPNHKCSDDKILMFWSEIRIFSLPRV